jgi:preprotein translocase subunit SecF
VETDRIYALPCDIFCYVILVYTELRLYIGEIMQENNEPKQNIFYKIYDKHYKILLLIPILLLLASIGIISWQMTVVTPGEFVNKGVSLKGGITIQIDQAAIIDTYALEESFSTQGSSVDANVKTITELGNPVGYRIEVIGMSTEEILTHLEQYFGVLTPDDYALEETGSVLAANFFTQTLIAIGISFVLMGGLVSLYFRIPIPSLAIIFAAAADIIMTIAFMDLFGMKLTTAGIAALLMLIGYSVDTDILLSSRVLKEIQGTVLTRTIDAMKTGMTMNITTLGALQAGLFLAQSQTLYQIFLILTIGIALDIINTWLLNAGILRWYLETHTIKTKKWES